VLIAGQHARLPDDPALADLFLHLVASHHGHARPFAPVSDDPAPPAVAGALGGTPVQVTSGQRAAWIPHRADSGLAERFWQLTRRHGWWGLAYLEAILRLGDWYASGLSMAKPEPAEVRG
jgi:CRISPR-associated endonuclease/helicase Cas3